MRICEGLKPEKVFYYFEDLCRIPHGSGNEKAISDYLVSFAKDRGLKVRQDEAFNVVIEAPATKGKEDREGVILQGHMDMVAVKDEDVDIDLVKDGLRLSVEGDHLFAKGTSLGGDDGIAVAMALAILDDPSIPHPALTVIVTTDEEVGMTGAAALNCEDITARALINIDSEDEGVCTCGCAGGMRIDHTLPVQRIESKGQKILLTMTGLKGGHSGVEIDKGRGNACILLARFLCELKAEKLSYQLLTFEGGEKDNAIPLLATAALLTDTPELIIKRAEEYTEKLHKEYELTDAGVRLETKLLGEEVLAALTNEDSEKAAGLIYAMPDGIQSMCAAIPTLPETSLNLGILKLEDSKLCFSQALRSSVSSRKEALALKVMEITRTFGGESHSRSAYPAWEYKADSRLRELALDSFEKLFGKKMKVDVIHAGLECGLLSEKMPGLDAISIGPDLTDIHTTKETLHIESTRRCFELICEILNTI